MQKFQSGEARLTGSFSNSCIRAGMLTVYVQAHIGNEDRFSCADLGVKDLILIQTLEGSFEASNMLDDLSSDQYAAGARNSRLAAQIT
jgi:hypothetical protein